VPCLGGEHGWCPTIGIQRIDAGAVPYEGLDHDFVPVSGSQMQGRTIIAIRDIDWCSAGDKPLYILHIACRSRNVQLIRRTPRLLLASAGKKDDSHHDTQ